MKKILLILSLGLLLFASNCDTKFFSYANSINKNERLSIKSFLNLLVTQKCDINIIYKDNIAKEIVQDKMPYVRIKNYSLREILDLILTQKGLFYTLNGNNLEISYYKTKTYKINFISSTRSGESKLDATDNKIQNTYEFDFWDKVKNQISDLLNSNFSIDPNYSILKANGDNVFPPVVDKDSGLIMITGTMKQLKVVDEYIKNLMNSLTKEVLIDVHIYSVELSASHKTGIDWANLSLSLGYNNNHDGTFSQNPLSVPLRAKYLGGSEAVFNAATFNIAGFLNFLAQNGNVNSISNPKIMTLNNQQAIISVGNTIYYKYASKVVTDQNGNPSTQYTVNSEFVGVVLDITPQISDDGTIILSISPKLSKFRDINQLSDTNRGMPPDTTDNTMQSIVKLKDNQTLVLGGLITNDKTLQVNGVPVLKEIPLIKYLFSSREKITDKKELVFVITPHIIDFKKKKTLRDLGFGQIH